MDYRHIIHEWELAYVQAHSHHKRNLTSRERKETQKERGYCPQPGPSKKYPLLANKEKATNTNRGKKSTTSKILKQENTVRN